MNITVSVQKPYENKQIDTRWLQVKHSSSFTPRSSFSYCYKGNFIYIHGGYSSDEGIMGDLYRVELSDTYEDRKWQRLKYSGKIKELKLRSHSLINELCYLLCIGGQKNMIENNQHIYRFDLRYQQWTICQITTNMQQTTVQNLLARDSHISILYNQNIYVFGGYLSSGQYTSQILKISTQNLSQNKLKVSQLQYKNGSIPSPRSTMGYCTVNHELYIFGGTYASTLLNDFWKFDLEEQKWFEIQKKDGFWPEKRKGCSLCFHENSGNIFLFGGIQQVTKQRNDVCIYLISRQKWVKIHYHTNNLYDPSPTIKKQIEDSPTILESKRKKQKRKQQFRLTLKSSPCGQTKNLQKEALFNSKFKINPNRTQNNFRSTNLKRLSVTQQRKRKEFFSRKKHLFSSMKKSHNHESSRPLSPLSEALNFSINQIGSQKVQSQKKNYNVPKVIYDQEKGEVIGKKPCARDGHAAISISDRMYIIGGDRHMVSFNDTHVFRMDKALQSVIHYSK